MCAGMLHTKFHNSDWIQWSPFPRNGQNMALLWPKHGPHMVLQIGSSWIIIDVPRDASCQISRFWVYPIVPFSSKWQKYGLFRPKHGPHMVLQIGSSWILINVPRDAPCQISESYHLYWQLCTWPGAKGTAKKMSLTSKAGCLEGFCSQILESRYTDIALITLPHMHS